MDLQDLKLAYLDVGNEEEVKVVAKEEEVVVVVEDEKEENERTTTGEGELRECNEFKHHCKKQMMSKNNALVQHWMEMNMEGEEGEKEEHGRCSGGDGNGELERSTKTSSRIFDFIFNRG